MLLEISFYSLLVLDCKLRTLFSSLPPGCPGVQELEIGKFAMLLVPRASAWILSSVSNRFEDPMGNAFVKWIKREITQKLGPNRLIWHRLRDEFAFSFNKGDSLSLARELDPHKSDRCLCKTSMHVIFGTAVGLDTLHPGCTTRISRNEFPMICIPISKFGGLIAISV